MTYDQIEALLTELDLEATLSSLRRAVGDEAHALSQTVSYLRGRRDRGRMAEQEARQYYAEDISEALAERQTTIAPGQILSHRRKPTAWAIAQFILQAAPERIY